MKKLMNAPADFVDQALDGLTLANPSLVRDGENGRVIRRAEGARNGKVGIASGGGSGHLPLFTGYVGKGLLDTCSIGNVFEGPNVGSCMDAIKLADGGRGVLRLYGNYGGDRMNFDMAGEMLEDEIRTTTVLGTDDIASAAPEESQKRRGVAGIIYAYKIAGAKAETDADLDEVPRLQRAPFPPPARLAFRWRRARCPVRPSRPLRSVATRSKWAWASMASPVSGATS